MGIEQFEVIYSSKHLVCRNSIRLIKGADCQPRECRVDGLVSSCES